MRVCVFVTPPPVAVTVRLAVPEAALDLAVRVSVLLPFPGEEMLVGKNAAVTPLGNPLTDRATAEVRCCTAVVMVKVVTWPTTKVALGALEVTVMVGTTTVRLNA